ncbi:MAG: hypothetical protein OXB88_09260 [Bacteriovoracales bacterium]|nr:hypothetical protein [Bacteriovoracales bacterium]
MNLSHILDDRDDFELLQGIDLSNYSTTKLESKGNLLIIKSIDALKYLLPILNQSGVRYTVIGLGANQILCERPDLLFIKLKLPFDKEYLSKKRALYHLPASVSLSLLINHAKKFELKGWEYMTGIPATIGGAAYMNAGTNLGDMSSLIKKVYLIKKDGGPKVIEITKKSYSYRKNHFMKEGEIIYAIDIISLGQEKGLSNKIDSYLKKRAETQPWKEKTCGCIFKNISKTCRAGHSIDILNLKGLFYRGIQIDHLHGNFFINTGQASPEDFIDLISVVQDELYIQFGKKFETEIKIAR